MNFPFGIFIGAFLALLLSCSLDQSLSASIERVAPSLFASAVGLIAACLALAAAMANITNQNEIVNNQRIARLVAARAVLPLTLSRIYETCTKGISVSAEIETLRNDHLACQPRFSELALSEFDLKTLKECIEVADISSAAWISLIIAHFQIELSRTRTKLFDLNLLIVPHQISNQAVDWCLLRAMVAHLFNFSRTGTPAPNDLRSDLFSFPLDLFNISRAIEDEMQNSILETRSYFEQEGGWSYKAFLDRLALPL